MKEVVLKTERLVLRPVRLIDAKGFYAHSRFDEVAVPIGLSRKTGIRHTLRFLRGELRQWRRKSPQRFMFSIWLRDDRQWIGGINVRKTGAMAGVFEIGYSLHPDHWGHGYATEAAEKLVGWAFAALGAHRVQATCWTRNRRSVKVLARTGMRREGTLKAYQAYEGELRDHSLYAITRQEWNRRQTAALKRALRAT